jgi:dihydrofolate synthase/folylpolyglutamate synthase
MAQYADVLTKVFALSEVRGMNRSLSEIAQLSLLYGYPHNAYPTIHVAGTNGKGSVCTKLAASLQKAGYTTGLYTSPHISTFRERIRVGGEMISEEEMAALLEEVTFHLEVPATFFEIATLIAFLHFQRKGVEIAVIETGLGGRLDATNVITPLVSIITSIGYDHTDVLGTSLDEIAREKAGIIKRGVPVIIGPDVPYGMIKERADALGSPLYQSSCHGDDFDRDNQEIARCALTLLQLQFPCSEAAIREGLMVKPPCRFERHCHQKEVILDVAHNVPSIERLLQMLRHAYPQHDYRFVVGFSKGKDILKCARLIQEAACAVHVVNGPHPRLAPADDVHRAFGGGHLEASIGQGVQSALRAVSPKPEVVVITGSFFIMGEARKALGLNDPEDPCIWYDPLKILTRD